MRDRLHRCRVGEQIGENIYAGVDSMLKAVVEPGLEESFLRCHHLRCVGAELVGKIELKISQQSPLALGFFFTLIAVI